MNDNISYGLGCFSLIAILGYGLFQAYAGYVGIAYHFGIGWAIAAILAAIFIRFSLPLAIGSFFGAMNVWGWPWYGALAFSFPMLALMIPGIFSSAIFVGLFEIFKGKNNKSSRYETSEFENTILGEINIPIENKLNSREEQSADLSALLPRTHNHVESNLKYKTGSKLKAILAFAIAIGIVIFIFFFFGFSIEKLKNTTGIQEYEKQNKDESVTLGMQEIPTTIKSFTLIVKIDDVLTNILDFNLIKNRVELESIKNGISVTTNYQSDAVLLYSINTIKMESNDFFSYCSRLSIVKRVDFEINSKQYSTVAAIWVVENSGFCDYDKFKDKFSDIIQSNLNAMSFDIIRTKLKNK
jgi:hypothetical protein